MNAAALIAVLMTLFPYGTQHGSGSSDQGRFQLLLSAGYGQSSFSEDFLGTAEQEACIPVGIQFLCRVSDRVHAGLEANTTLVKYNWDELAEIGINVSLSQTLYGTLLRYMIPISSTLSPYARAGLGVYTGKHEATLGDLAISRPLDTNVGANLGAGITTVGADVCLGFEFVYHFVKHRYDDTPDMEPWEMNNWSVALTASSSF